MGNEAHKVPLDLLRDKSEIGFKSNPILGA